MTSSLQLLLVGACSLALAGVCAFAKTEARSPVSIVSYWPTRKQEASRQSELNMAAASVAPHRQASNGQPFTQPSVYHSIIDRSASSSIPAAPIQASSLTTSGDLNTAAGHHHGHAHGKYYEYREVPKKKTWKFGYKRGNHKHTISRHEHGKAGKHPHFKTKVKWHDKKSKGKGIHLWDYNHHDKKHYHHG